MTETIIAVALRLPASTLEAPATGSTIAILASAFYHPQKDFALCQCCPDAEEVSLSVWARCQQSLQYDDQRKCDRLATLLSVPIEDLQAAFAQKGFIWLTYLRVYRLPAPVRVKNRKPKATFLALEDQIYIRSFEPVLDDFAYEQQKKYLKALQLPVDPILEPLAWKINSIAPALAADIQVFLGLMPTPPANLPDWIRCREIVTLGDRSIEGSQTTKSSVQAGTDFENVTKKALEFLGFTVEAAHKGGAGGLDLFCSEPYPLAGECKAGQTIPSGAVEELIKIAQMHLEEKFESAVKLIIGPGKPTKDLTKSARLSKISLLDTMTLQRLVELHAVYPGCIDLIELKKYLIAGQGDDEIQKYIEKVGSPEFMVGARSAPTINSMFRLFDL